MRIEIIEGKEEHLEELVKLIESSEIGERYFLNKNKNIYKMMRKGVKEKGVYLAIKNNQTVGFFHYSREGVFSKYPYLHLIIICPKERGKGYGSELLDYFENKLSKNYNKVFLMVGDFNINAKKLYERVGYEVVGKLPGFYVDEIDEYLMLKTKLNKLTN